MKDYKHTLNLPKTTFSMKANLAQREPGIIEFWNKIDLYTQLKMLGEHRKKFILHDGPPYANGQIHIGHAVNKILKDIILKSKTLNGYFAPFVPGWDCHGLPIELNVEKKTANKKLSPKAFREACREYANTQIHLQKEAFIRLGILGDWLHPYKTMDFSYEANIIRALASIMEQGYIQKGQKPVHWCVDCQSALAEAEVEYKNKTSKEIDVAFRVENVEVLRTCFQLPDDMEFNEHTMVELPIWTTTPWTLPANEAVAVGEEIEYTLFRAHISYQDFGEVLPSMMPAVDQFVENASINHDSSNSNLIACYFILATQLSGEIFSRYKIQHYTAFAQTLGRNLTTLKVKHPLLPKVVPVVIGHHVSLDAGTGVVHIAPSHGIDDYEIGQLNHLPLQQLVDNKGCYIPNAPLLPGAHVLKVNPDIVNLLKESHQLLAASDLEHSYPHCWRHKTPLIFRATPQWFIGMEKHHLRQETLKAIRECAWIPNWGRARISNMIANRPDWCISRQRMWGTPIPLFIHKETQLPHPESVSLMHHVANLVEKAGIDAWFDLPGEELLGEEAHDYFKLTDSLDVWFDSGVSHFCVLQQNADLGFPADLYLEGSDQHRGWFHSSILTSVALNHAAPYKRVLTHGYAVDEKGHKMSKSLGNVIDPLDIVKTLGADILRLWVASTDYRSEISVSQSIISQSGEIYRRIRNTARFILSNLWDFEVSDCLDETVLWDIDKWAIQEAKHLTQAVKHSYDEFQFHLVCKKIHQFCNDDLGGFYLDILKDRLYTLGATSQGRRSAQTALYFLINALVTWIAPILSFTAEEIWQCLKEKEAEKPASVFFTLFPETFLLKDKPFLSSDFSHAPLAPSSRVKEEEGDWSLLKKVKSEVNHILERYRNEGKIGSSLDAVVILYCHQKEKIYHFLFSLNQQEEKNKNQGLRFILITSAVKIIPTDEQDFRGIETNVTGLRVEIEVSADLKCQRCWHHRMDVGMNEQFPDLCGRCVENLNP